MVYNNDFVVTIKCDGKILREKKGIVYLPFGAEYSILMKNLSSKRALVDIEIDGESVLESGKLIIDANSKLDLERYVKDNKKGNRFRFIEKTDKISEHRGDKVDDGIVRVSYQFEKPIEITYEYTVYPRRRECPYNPLNPWVTREPYVWYSDTTGNSFEITSDTVTVNDQDKDNMSFCDSKLEDRSVLCSTQASEEGITVPGSVSNQEFVYGSIGTLENEEHVITLQLKGGTEEEPVREPITVKTKISCVTCGRTNSGRFNYCTECGTALKIY